VADDSAKTTVKRKNRSRRTEVVAAAAELFYVRGYEATSVQDIADSLGMLKGSVYYYMDSKEDLLFEIIERGHQQLIELVQGVLDLEHMSPREQLSEFVSRHSLFVAENLVLLRIFFNDFRSLGEERRATVIAERDRYDELVRGILIRGQASGDFHREFDPKIVALGILGMTNWLYQWFRADGGLSASEVGAQLAELAVSGVAPRA